MDAPLVIHVGVHRLIMRDSPSAETRNRRLLHFRAEDHFNPTCCGLCSAALELGATFKWDEHSVFSVSGPTGPHRKEERIV